MDDGLFGQTLILSAFNYAEGEVYGTEFTVAYDKGGFSSYANVAYSVARGKDWSSAQFLFDPADAAYVKNNWISLDHDQRVSGSFGTSYLWKESERSGTRFLVDALYGSGLRTDATAADGSNIPNGGTVAAYYSVNCGVEQSFKINKLQSLKARIDIVNVTDHRYELRDGSGVGVNATRNSARVRAYLARSPMSSNPTHRDIMLKMDANRTPSGVGLKSELAASVSPAGNRDPNHQARVGQFDLASFFFSSAWRGLKRSAAIQIKAPPPLEEVVPTIVRIRRHRRRGTTPATGTKK